MDGDGKATRYPFDYDAISKGDRIEPEVIEEIVGVKRKTYRYGLKIGGLVQQVDRELRARGKCFTVCIRDHGISILTDAEASIYNTDRFKHCQSGLARSNVRMAEVDTSGFSEASRAKHDRQLKDQGAILSAIAAAARRNKLEHKKEGMTALDGPMED